MSVAPARQGPAARQMLTRQMPPDRPLRPEYISPEIIKGVPYNHSVDWWSFGELCAPQISARHTGATGLTDSDLPIQSRRAPVRDGGGQDAVPRQRRKRAPLERLLRANTLPDVSVQGAHLVASTGKLGRPFRVAPPLGRTASPQLTWLAPDPDSPAPAHLSCSSASPPDGWEWPPARRATSTTSPSSARSTGAPSRSCACGHRSYRKW